MLVASLFMLNACDTAEEQHAEGTPIRVYYKAGTDVELSPMTHYLEASDTEGSVRELLDTLFSQPDTRTMKSPKPENLTLRSFTIGEDEQLVLDFSSEYYSMEKISEILFRASVVRTLCQIDGIDYVEFTVEGQDLTLSGDTPVGQMAAADFIDNTGSSTELRQTSYVTVYFANEKGDGLNAILIEIESNGSKSNEQLVADQIIKGPETIEGASGVFPSIADGTTINKIATKDGVCYVDLSEEFLLGREGVKAEVSVYSLVDSLCELPGVQKVKLSVGGDSELMMGGISLSEVFGRKLELIAEGQ